MTVPQCIIQKPETRRSKLPIVFTSKHFHSTLSNTFATISLVRLVSEVCCAEWSKATELLCHDSCDPTLLSHSAWPFSPWLFSCGRRGDIGTIRPFVLWWSGITCPLNLGAWSSRLQACDGGSQNSSLQAFDAWRHSRRCPGLSVSYATVPQKLVLRA